MCARLRGQNAKAPPPFGTFLTSVRRAMLADVDVMPTELEEALAEDFDPWSILHDAGLFGEPSELW